MTYNDYIFNAQDKVIIRDFEGAYKHNDNVYPLQFDIVQPKFRLAMDAIKKYGPECSVLDIGAGYGVLVNHILALNIPNAVGVEISASAIQRGKEIFGQSLPLLEGDLTKTLPFPQKSFDVIVCFGVIGWLLDDADFCISEIKRLLKKEGTLFISMGFHDNHIFFRDVISSIQDFPLLLGKYFKVESFFVDYHEIGEFMLDSKCINFENQQKDLVAICRML